MISRIRLTVLLTHPAQNMTPWFRHIEAHLPEIDLTVLYGAIPDADQQGAGFGRAFTWDVPLTGGYRHAVCAGPAGKSFESDRFLGIDVPDIGRHIAATQPDVLLVPGWHSILQVRALRAARRLRIPVLYRGDSTLFSGPRALLRPAWSLKTRQMLRQFDGYLSVGAHADEYLQAFGVPEPAIVRSPHCVDNDRFRSAARQLRSDGTRERERAAIGASPDDFVVLFAGKLQPRKRPADAVRAVARLGPKAVLMIAGDGPLAGGTRAEADRLGVRLAWRGFLNQSQLPLAFAASDCVVVPSRWESWGLIVNEALASDLPCVVTTAVACAPDLIREGATGFAVPPGDVAGLAHRLDDVRRARAAGHDFAPACRAQVEACSFDAASRGLVDACRVTIARRIPESDEAPVRVVACCGGMVSVFGVERVNFATLRVLRDHGASVHCIVNSWKSAAIVGLAREIGATWSPGGYLAPARRRGLTPAAVARLAVDVVCTSAVLWRDARRLRATHVLVPDFVTVLRNAPALAALRAAGISIVLNVQNAPDPAPFYQRLWRWAVGPFVDRFVANSQFTAAELVGAGIPERKVCRVYNTAPQRAPSGPPSSARDYGRIIFVGQVIPAKGVDLLLDAVGVLVDRGVDARLDVVGDIDGWESPAWQGYHAALRARAARADLAGRVRFLGMREDVPALLAASAVHCAPSRPENREAFGIVVAEAKEAGLPSVVTPSGALPELVTHRSDGWVCGDASAEALAEGLEHFLADPIRSRIAGIAARQSAQRLDCTSFARGWLEVFGFAPPRPAAIEATVESHAG